MTSEPPVSPRIIIMPVDDSPHCERAFNWYLKRAHRPEDKLILVHVIQPRYVSPPGGIVIEHAVTNKSSSTNDGIEVGKQVLDKYAQKCKKANFIYETTLKADADPGKAIIQVGDDYFANLIVIASRGMSKARRTILGSASHYVVYHSGIPVLVVPPAKRSSASFEAEVEQAKKD
ncbi:universal stress protein [Echinococcus multilocularis]|uniref:Universal stress protein n=1 Tax=Echinococcus multilocularis TaxID=6211 RepID=A0A068Y7Q5_ECHMU|nr:universal stress protein [Echinococcus multilocularis]